MLVFASPLSCACAALVLRLCCALRCCLFSRTAIEMGMKNHELVPTPLICTIAALSAGPGAAFKIINTLHRNKLIYHENKVCQCAWRNAAVSATLLFTSHTIAQRMVACTLCAIIKVQSKILSLSLSLFSLSIAVAPSLAVDARLGRTSTAIWSLTLTLVSLFCF